MYSQIHDSRAFSSFLALVLTALLALSCRSDVPPSPAEVTDSEPTVAAAALTRAKPAPIAVGSVEMRSGKTYAMSELTLVQTSWSDSFRFYERYSNYSVDYVPLYDSDMLAHEIPLATIRSLELTIGKDDVQSDAFIAQVTLNDGRKMQGRFWNAKGFYDHRVTALEAKATVDGFPADISVALSEISRVAFDQSRTATIQRTDGTKTGGLRDVQFNVDAEDSRSGSQDASTIRLTRGEATLEIPLAEIATITLQPDQDTIVTHQGRQLVGSIGHFTYVLEGVPILNDDRAGEISCRLLVPLDEEGVSKITFQREKV